MNLPRISLVTCSFQQARYLGATLRSVLDQSYPDLEYVVVDGGSTDGSVDVIRRHARGLAWWVSEPDGGQTDALIKGFARTSGDIQGWLCSDDLLLPGALASVGRFFAEHPEIDAVYGDAVWIDAAGNFLRCKREIGFDRFVMLFDHNYIPQPSMFWRRALYERVGGLDRRFNLAMDNDLWERFSRHGRIAHLDAYLSCMRYYPQQKTRAMRPEGRREDEEIRMREALGRVPVFMPALCAGARLVRVGRKFAAGGYFARPSPLLLEAIGRYRIAGAPA